MQILLDGHLEIDGPGGGIKLDANGDTLRVEFGTLRAAVAVWRASRKWSSTTALRQALATSGLNLEVHVRGVRVMQIAAER